MRRCGRPISRNLYDLAVELVDDGETVDAVSSYFGMRKIEVKKDDDGINRLWLNNKVLFQYGPLDQGWWPDGLYTPASDEAHEVRHRDDEEAGHEHGPQAREVRVRPLVLLVRQAGAVGVAGHAVRRYGPASDESRANFRRELQAMIDALHNHPSIVMWVPFNEGWGQHDTPEVVAWIKEYDPTRPVNEASGWHDRGSGDVSDMHSYPGPGMRAPEEDRVSRAGRVRRAGHAGFADTPGRTKRTGATCRTTTPMN